MLEHYIALTLTKMKERLVEFITDEEAETLQVVIDFYNFAWKEKLKRNPQEVLNELLEAMMFTYTDGEEDSEE